MSNKEERDSPAPERVICCYNCNSYSTDVDTIQDGKDGRCTRWNQWVRARDICKDEFEKYQDSPTPKTDDTTKMGGACPVCGSDRIECSTDRTLYGCRACNHEWSGAIPPDDVYECPVCHVRWNHDAYPRAGHMIGHRVCYKCSGDDKGMAVNHSPTKDGDGNAETTEKLIPCDSCYYYSTMRAECELDDDEGGAFIDMNIVARDMTCRFQKLTRIARENAQIKDNRDALNKENNRLTTENETLKKERDYYKRKVYEGFETGKDQYG